ncbi:MAG: ribonuclease III [Candidatus Magasanikbacteria bacterium RIFOXYC2_FULL_42_28]|uniref:Ribonuclease 3 n=1 Tax=Candidatus Magasanikbacteria bacterium RIFOXYC2_FULL_42_28 TaxID=1798704 RepID=A0A1F6NVL8_9BACT|nr:MAG: ribonuclease III [Candidatus Magasanikbacteria bacterium RIFOXYC2_FULL_42_28]
MAKNKILDLPEVKEKDFAKFQEILNTKFKHPEILVQSCVHRSYLNEHRDFPIGHNERLEFLGDAVLELIVTEFLFSEYRNPEGELTNWRAALVNANTLAKIAYEIDLEPYLFLSHGESKDAGTKARDYIMANLFEAVTGAIYWDRGYDAAKQFITHWVISKLPHILEHGLYLDSKSRFQESAQELTGITPTYKVLREEGPDHAKHFVVGVYLGKELVAEGAGLSKQEAQTEAAEAGILVKGWKGPKITIIKREEKDGV